MGTGKRISERTLASVPGIEVEVIVDRGLGNISRMRATLARITLIEGRLIVHMSADKIYSDRTGKGKFEEDNECLPQHEISLVEAEETEEDGVPAVCSGRTKVFFKK